MAKAKASRHQQKQLGQYLTPQDLADRIVAGIDLDPEIRVLEPSFGDGSFLIPLIRRLLPMHSGDVSNQLEEVMTKNIFGTEIDEDMFRKALVRIEEEFGPLPKRHNLVRGDFFKQEYPMVLFDVIIGNPPFGGTFDPEIEDRLDRLYGSWGGHKIKKETYSFFITACLDLLAPNGELVFIVSDTFMTINTMAGLRRRLMDLCEVRIERLAYFSGETTQPTLVMYAARTGESGCVRIDGGEINRSLIESTGNFSWGIEPGLSHFFGGPTIGDFLVATSGMTIGKNELFVREISEGAISEPYEFEFFEDPITLERELERARLGKISQATRLRIKKMESEGVTRRNVRVVPRKDGPKRIKLPNPDYPYYNKAQSEIVYSDPKWVVFWQNQGEAVLTFKKNGNWYLGGVGGQKFFGREGLTWPLISSRINMRYLPIGYVLDSGGPCAFLRPGVHEDELWFILGWCLTDKATEILKTVLNHTRNIQGKDIERMPYPTWISQGDKMVIVELMRTMVERGMAGERFDRSLPEIAALNGLFEYREVLKEDSGRGNHS